ncbi:MAG: IS1634 family transposase [Acidobacteriota bacterium]
MTSLIKKIKKGKPYYYAVESARVEGKPRIVWQKYLGTLDAIVKRSDATQPQPPREALLFEAGGSAALLRITQRLGLLELINDVVSKRDQGLSMGHYIVLAALNRALDPCSKSAIGGWYEQSILKRLWRFPRSAFSSQRFWDHMDRITPDQISRIEEELLPRILRQFRVDSEVLLYDTTNFFTFLASSNDRAVLPQRGHSKAKRHDLRQIGLALLVTREFQIPLLHRVYEGNIPDVTLFPEISRELVGRYGRFSGNTPQATLIFDKGNVSEDAMEDLVVSGARFVAALSANRLSEALEIPLDQYQSIPAMPGTRAVSAVMPYWGKSCQVVVSYSESFFTQQLSGVTQHMVKCQGKLSDLQQRLDKWQNGKAKGRKPPTLKSVQSEVKKILASQFMNTIFNVEVQEQQGLPVLNYSVDHGALQTLAEQRLGKTILITDHLDWTSARVIEAYRNLSGIEQSFKHMKNVRFLRWQPAYHWTDQKLRVHAFYCVLALLVSSLAHKEVRQADFQISLPSLLKELTSIRQVALLYPPGSGAKSHITLSRMSPRQKKLSELLHVHTLLAEG